MPFYSIISNSFLLAAFNLSGGNLLGLHASGDPDVV